MTTVRRDEFFLKLGQLAAMTVSFPTRGMGCAMRESNATYLALQELTSASHVRGNIKDVIQDTEHCDVYENQT